MTCELVVIGPPRRRASDPPKGRVTLVLGPPRWLKTSSERRTQRYWFDTQVLRRHR